MKSKLLFGLISLLTAVSTISARTVEIPVSRVAVISPGENEGDPFLGPRICLKFNIPESLQGKEIGSADLIINLDSWNMPEDSIIIFESYLLQSDWTENIGWNDFVNPGGDLDSTNYSCHSFKFGTVAVTGIDITDMVSEWNSQELENYGLILIPRNTRFYGLRTMQLNPNLLRTLITLRVLVSGR